MLNSAKKYAKTHGFDNLQELIRETLRERLFQETISGSNTAKASEAALAKDWLTEEEDDAWAHLQKET